MEYVISILVLLIYIFLFKKAAGTLKPNLLNVISFTFYSILFFQVIGVTIVYLGFRDHYIINKIVNEETIQKTYYFLTYAMICMPIIMILVNQYVYKLKPKELEEKYINKLKEPVILGDVSYQNRMFVVITILAVICLASIIYVFTCIKYIPVLKYFDSDFNFAVERINISRNFAGNQYIKNLVMLTITPMISYITYIYMKVTKEKRWRILFIILLFMSVLALTYNFEKSTIIYYFIFFFIIHVLLGKTFKLKSIIPIAVAVIVIILILYKTVMGYNDKILSLSSGPVSRIIMGQSSTLFLHVDAFPEIIPFLGGRSFPEIFKFVFGTEGEYDVRSGREVMETYAKAAVEEGRAGVMNTLYIGEAYANFGIVGLIISPIIVSFIFSTILCLLLKFKKTPLNMILYLESFIIFTNVLQGGFVDFFYNVKFFVVLLTIFIIHIFATSKKENTHINLLMERKEK